MEPDLPRPALAADLALALALGAAFACLAAPGLDVPPTPVMDEVHHAGSALARLAGQAATETTHPPLAKHLMALGAWLGGHAGAALGPAPLAAMRAPAVVAGALGVMATYGLARALSGRRAVGAFAAALLALDGAWLVHARVAMTNVYGAAAIAAGGLALALALRRGRPGWLLGAGAAFGLAVACRWSALPALAIAAGLWLAPFLRHAEPGEAPPEPPLPVALVVAAIALAALPAAVYALTFVPLLGLDLPGILAAQGGMWAHHSTYQAPHPFQSPWWSWPLMLQPAWYDFRYDPATHTARAVWAIGNACVWWAAVPALGWTAWRAWKAQDRALAVVPALGLGLWLAWAVQPRGVVFMHYMLEAIPFACVAIALAAAALWDLGKPASRGAVAAYAACAVAWLAFFHPLLTARPITADGYAARIWYVEGWEFNAVVNRFRREHGLEDPEEWRRWRESPHR